jgi:hypothetical protein
MRRLLLIWMTPLIRFLLWLCSVSHQHWQKEYRTMGQNICTVLRLAQEPVTAESVLAFAAGLPRAESDLHCRKWRDTYCYRCLKKAYDHTKKTRRKIQFAYLCAYFVDDFVKSTHFYKRQLMAAQLGVLNGLSLDGTPELYQRLFRMHARPPEN